MKLNVINHKTLQGGSVLKWLFIYSAVSCIALMLGKKIASIHSTDYGILAAIVISFLLIISVKFPEFLLLVTYLLIQNVFRFGTWKFSLPIGAFGFHDLLFLIWWSILLFRYLKGQKITLLKSPFNKLFTVMLIWIVFGFIYTIIVMGGNMQESFNAARPFFYYFLFYPFLILIVTKVQVNRLIKWLYICAILSALISLCFYFMGIKTGGPFVYWGVTENFFMGTNLIGSPLYGLYFILICSSFSTFILSNSWKRKILFLFTFFLMATMALLSLGRGYCVGVAIGLVVSLLLSLKVRLLRSIKSLFLFPAAIGILLIALWSIGIEGSLKQRMVLTKIRAEIGMDCMQTKSGTYGERMKMMSKKAIGKDLLLGTLFYYGPKEEFSFSDNPYTMTYHNLYGDILLRMGLVGLMWYLGFFIVLIKRSISVFHIARSSVYRGLLIGFAGATVGYLLWAVSTSYLIMKQGIVSLVLMAVVIEHIYRVDSKKQLEISNKNVAHN